MVRRLREEEIKLWSRVASTVKAGPGMTVSRTGAKLDHRAGPMILSAEVFAPAGVKRLKGVPEDIEPNRKRHIIREHHSLEARLDLHGMDQDRAQAALNAFLHRAHEAGHRAALVITGRGVQGFGVLKRRAPEWLSAPDLRHIVAGFSEAHQKHGGDGAIYVALKRKRAV